MNHLPTDQCIGCRAVRRLKIVDEDQCDAVHRLTEIMVAEARLCYETAQFDFDVTSDDIVSVIEDVIAETMAIQPPSTTTLN